MVQMPESVSYWFRSLGRGPAGEALLHGTDGKLYVFDPITGDQIKTIDVTGPWSEPDDWQQGAPAVFTREDSVYVQTLRPMRSTSSTSRAAPSRRRPSCRRRPTNSAEW
ncbi:hypothetical protein BCA37_02520 [Mycobacterium sp. djl-10]|nr:hypothetical protein BCA37_02520 [Mycobacterium sp. djl-10]